MEPARRPRLVLVRLTPCDGCEAALRACETAIREVAELELTGGDGRHDAARRRAWDVALVAGAITTPHDAARVRGLRRRAKQLVALGACSTAGGMEALQAFAGSRERRAAPYPQPCGLAALSGATPLAQHVRVDHELRGCPISKAQLIELLCAILHQRRPNLPAHSVCLECKRRGAVCVLVARGVPCLGPLTHAGCGALCPPEGRGCEACFGPMDAPGRVALAERLKGLDAVERGPLSVFQSPGELLWFGPRAARQLPGR